MIGPSNIYCIYSLRLLLYFKQVFLEIYVSSEIQIETCYSNIGRNRPRLLKVVFYGLNTENENEEFLLSRDFLEFYGAYVDHTIRSLLRPPRNFNFIIFLGRKYCTKLSLRCLDRQLSRVCGSWQFITPALVQINFATLISLFKLTNFKRI